MSWTVMLYVVERRGVAVFLGTPVKLMNLPSWLEVEVAVWTGAEQSGACSLVHWACDFPVGILLGSASLTNLSLYLPCSYWGGLEETPAS